MHVLFRACYLPYFFIVANALAMNRVGVDTRFPFLIDSESDDAAVANPMKPTWFIAFVISCFYFFLCPKCTIVFYSKLKLNGTT